MQVEPLGHAPIRDSRYRATRPATAENANNIAMDPPTWLTSLKQRAPRLDQTNNPRSHRRVSRAVPTGSVARTCGR